jgi:predicted dienelactone hydrolase
MAVETVRLFDETRAAWTSDLDPRPISARLWVPEDRSGPLPLILLSHGTGGAAEDFDWLAERLNAEGFLVAGVDHHGNTYNEDYFPEGFAFNWERPKDVSFLLGCLSRNIAIDSSRIGAIGFSIGGYTVAALLGAEIDIPTMTAVIDGAVPAPPLPEFPDLIPTLRAKLSAEELSDAVAGGTGSVADSRISAGFAIAPAIGRLVDPQSLAGISKPLEIRWGGADDITPPEDNALVYLESVPTAEGHCVGDDVGHYVFLGDRDDPSGVRGQVAEDAAAFFRETL